MRLAEFRLGLAIDRADVDVDFDAQVRIALANGIAQVFEVHFAVGTGVDDHDQAAPSPHQLVDPQVLEVPAVRQVDEVGVGVGQAEQFGNQAEQSDCGPECFQLFGERGFGHQRPRRTLKMVIRKARGGDEW